MKEKKTQSPFQIDLKAEQEKWLSL